MVVEILRPWRHFQPGAVVATLSDGIVNVLLERGVAKVAEPFTVDPPLPTRPAETTPLHRKDKRK